MRNYDPLSPVEPTMVAQRLIALRTALNLTKSEFADRIGLDRSSYTKIEKGVKPLPLTAAYRIWQVFGADMNYLFLGQMGSLPSSLSSRLTT